jgi:hypothetical protein
MTRIKTNRVRLAASVALASGLLVAAQTGAEARIRCDGNFQIVSGYPVSTPYCRDWHLVQVARSYGIHVSFEAIRHSDSAKGQVCRAVGTDIRVQEVCAPYRFDGGLFRRR